MKNEKGFTLIEVIVALALLGIISIAFLGGLATASKAIIIADERATAESLARSQMEYVKSQVYSIAPWAYELPLHTPSNPPPDPPSWWVTNTPALPEGYDGYTVNVDAEPLYDPDDGSILDGIQKIIVTVEHPDGETVIILEDYKVDR